MAIAITVLLYLSAVFLSVTVVSERYEKLALVQRNFAWICKEQRKEFASLGHCSRQYLECGGYNGAAVVRSCLDYQVWSDLDGCISGSESYCSISTYDRDLINSQTEQLAIAAKFCHRKEGVFFAASNRDPLEIDRCSRQAIVCSVDDRDSSVTAIVTCPKDTVLDVSTMNCTRSSYHCSDTFDYSDYNGVPFSVQQVLVNKICDAHPSYFHESKLCASWYLDCSRREVVNCRNDHFYDAKREECRPKHKVDSCIDETVCYGGEWSKKLPMAPCLQRFTWCRGGQIFEFVCVNGRVFDGRGCKDKDLVRECGGEICQQGETYKHEDCNRYTRCDGGQLIVESCGLDKAWSVDQQKCVYDPYCVPKSCAYYGTCTADPDLTKCNEGHSYRDIDHCTGKYMDCIDGYYKQKFCDPNYSWQVEGRKCVYDAGCNNLNGDAVKDECFADGTRAIDCYRYELCEYGKWQSKTCDEKPLFNWDRKICEFASGCSIESKATCVEGSSYASYNYCNRYWTCTSGKYIESDCGSNSKWSSELSKCVYDEKCNGDRTNECRDGTTLEIDCYRYAFCEQGAWKEMKCEFYDKAKSYSHNIRVCNCQPIEPQQCSKGYRYGHETDCNRYFECVDGRYHEKSCESTFASWHKDDSLCSFNRRCHRICEEGISYPHEDTKLCAKYRKCERNSFNYYECEKSFYFDAKATQCIKDRDYVCHPKSKPPTQHPVTEGCHGSHFKHDMCNKYYRCHHGKYTEETCGSGHAYNHDQLACVPDDSCRPYPKHCKIGSYSHYPFDCRFFYQCDHGKWALRPCAPGTAWNQQLLTCDHLGNGQCQ